MTPSGTSVTLTIDNISVTAPKGSTILDAARQNNILIPTLCWHPDLSPHGGCRMCIVEVEGLRTFPTACTTPAEDGMIVRTQTDSLQAMRMDILQLFLSEHTSSCLVCEEKLTCRESMSTVRKSGVTTGCRYCPKDGQCELQALAEQMDVTEIRYPISYRGLRVETEDPFYDRDYNLCILCGRCVRMCQEIRIANVLAYKHRGRNTVIGPAFRRTHLEAGCEFCGACVAVCPTGSLREKVREWEGKPDREVVSTCSFCGVGCQVRLLIKGNRVIGSLPANDPIVNNGQLCVKGRFCNTEIVNDHQRLRHPAEKYGKTRSDISWEKAIGIAAAKIAECKPDEFALLISTNCPTEDAYVAQKFVRTVTHSHSIDTTARVFYGSGFDAYTRLLKRSIPLSSLHESPLILTIGLDTRYGRSVVGVAIRRAMKNGARLATINPRYNNFSLASNLWIQPQPGNELQVLDAVRKLLKGEHTQAKDTGNPNIHCQVEALAGLLQKHPGTVILLGSGFLQYDHCADILKTIEQIAESCGAGIMPLPAQNNLVGSLLAGAYPEILPGGISVVNQSHRSSLEYLWNTKLPAAPAPWNITHCVSGTPLKVLYLIGELPPVGTPPSVTLLYQNILPPDPWCSPDLLLPAAAWTETDGTFINGEGRIQQIRKAVNPPGIAIPDWAIVCRIARAMGASGFEFESAADIRMEMGRIIGEYSGHEEPDRRPHQLAIDRFEDSAHHDISPNHVSGDGNSPFLLSVSVVEHSHRGFPLSAWVDGSKALLTEEMLEMNPADAAALGISAGESVRVSFNGTDKIWPARIVREQPCGIVHASLRNSSSIRPNPVPVTLRRANA
jgi:formate dehydrogenase (NADP+) alpha subunit